MGFWSSVGSFFSSACSWVSNSISSAASWAGRALSAAFSVGGSLIGSIGSFVSDVAKSLGIFREDDPPLPEWGDRAMQAEEQRIFPDQFENFEEYLDTLRNFSLDPDKSAESTLEQKTFKGIEVAGRALEYKYDAPEGSMGNLFVLAGVNPDYFTSDRFRGLLESGMDVRDISDYFEGRIGGAEALNIENELVDLDQKTNPGKDEHSSREELWQTAETTQDRVRNILS